MKLAFSTLGCPNYSWTDIYTMAKDLGFDGIEIRGLGENIYAVKAHPFLDSQIGKTLETLSRLNISIPCLSSGCCLKFKDREKENISEITEYIKLAAKLKTPYIRILADKEPDPEGDEVDDAYVAGVIRKLAETAGQYGVTLLAETNGVYADTSRLAKLLDMADSPNVGALWDFHHPYRFFNETPHQTVQNLGNRIKHVHIKDSARENGKIVYRLMGEGDMPLPQMIACLEEEINYDGYISLEWVKRWTPALQDGGIVFPQYANYMAPLLHRKEEGKRCFSKNGQGTFIWPKETLIDFTFPEVLDKMCEAHPNQCAFSFTETDYTRTYSEFRDDVDSFARSLISMGVKQGDHVAIWATNRPEWYITFWAATKIGAVLVSVNTAYKIHETEYLLRQSDTGTLVMVDSCKDSNYIEIMQTLCPELNSCRPGELNSRRLPVLKNIITIESSQPGCFSWKDALAKGEGTPLSEVYRRQKQISKNDVCNMQYTSGTTGFPKGVMLTHYNVINNGKAIGDCLDLSTADRMMIQVPMFHCFGMVLAMTACMTHGASISPIFAFSPKTSLACINQKKITAFHGVPTMFIAMLGHADFEKTDFSHMRTGIMAGSPCPVKVMEDVVSKMNMKEICITYGQTEASPGCTMSSTDDSLEKRVNTVGKAMFGVECRIVDPETGKDLPDNTDGEFLARGYNVMKGYYKMPEATAAVIDKDGWLHTGDLAKRLPDGYFKITGRIKDMIIRGGENIYPKEIEEFLYTNPKVQDVQVIGVPDSQYGEEIMACIILKEGETATEEEMKDFVKNHMAKHKTPRYIDFVKEFPMNAAGKILKYKMRENAVEKLKLQDASRIITA